MGFLDQVAGAVEKHPGINDQQHSSLIQAVWEKFGNPGGISQLVNSSRSQGLGEIVESWIGKEQNKPVSADEAKSLVGEDWVEEVAERTGIPQPIASEVVAKILPGVVDKATPQGKVAKAA